MMRYVQPQRYVQPLRFVAELKCCGGATNVGRHNLPARSVSLCISTWRAAGSGPHLSPARIPERKLFRNLDPPIPLDTDYKFLRSPIHPTPSSCVTCLLGPFARVPDVQGLDFPGYPCCPALCAPGSLLHVAPLPGVVSHGPAARSADILPVPLRHDSQINWLKTVSSRLVSVRSLSPAFQSDPLAWCPTASSPPVSGRFLSPCFGPAPLD